MTKHDIYDEIEEFQIWSYMECHKYDEGGENWCVNVEGKCGDEVVVPVAVEDGTCLDRGLEHVTGRQGWSKVDL